MGDGKTTTMKNVLLITSSPRGEASYSTRFATDLAPKLGDVVVARELWRDPWPAIDPSFVHAVFTPADARTDAQRTILERSDRLVAELKAADVVVIGAAMINFGMPAPLKTWIDLVSRSGETFRYGESGPEGLLKGKRAVLVLAAGGVYSSGPMSAMDHLEPALRGVLGFFGITDVETIWIEGVSMGPEAQEAALTLAQARSEEVLAYVR